LISPRVTSVMPPPNPPSSKSRSQARPALELQDYANVSVKIAHAPEQASAILQQYGLDEAAWDCVTEHWEQQLSQALGETQEDASVAPFVAAYAEAMQRAQQLCEVAPLPLDLYCSLLAAMRAGKPLPQVLQRREIAMSRFLSAQSYWMRCASHDPAVRDELLGHGRRDPGDPESQG